MKEIYCDNCQKSFGFYNEKYFPEKSLEKIKTQHGSLHIFYGHTVIIRDQVELTGTIAQKWAQNDQIQARFDINSARYGNHPI